MRCRLVHPCTLDPGSPCRDDGLNVLSVYKICVYRYFLLFTHYDSHRAFNFDSLNYNSKFKAYYELYLILNLEVFNLDFGKTTITSIRRRPE